MIVPLDIDVTSEWFKSFVLAPEAHDMVTFCQDLVRLNKVLIGKLDEQSLDLATFSCPFSRYRYIKL